MDTSMVMTLSNRLTMQLISLKHIWMALQLGCSSSTMHQVIVDMQIICCLPTKCQKAPTRLGVHARMAQKCVWVSILQTETIRISIGQRTIPQCQVGTKGWSRSSWNAICGLQVVYRLSIRGSSVHQDTLIAAARDCCSINPTSWHRSHTSRKTLSLVTLGAHHNVLPMHMLSMCKEKVKFSKMASFYEGFLTIYWYFRFPWNSPSIYSIWTSRCAPGVAISEISTQGTTVSSIS